MGKTNKYFDPRLGYSKYEKQAIDWISIAPIDSTSKENLIWLCHWIRKDRNNFLILEYILAEYCLYPQKSKSKDSIFIKPFGEFAKDLVCILKFMKCYRSDHFPPELHLAIVLSPISKDIFYLSSKILALGFWWIHDFEYFYPSLYSFLVFIKPFYNNGYIGNTEVKGILDYILNSDILSRKAYPKLISSN
jgi:hypothetical protein